jgi:long-subunit fatty acid transport protein
VNGVDSEGATLGAGFFYDISDTARVGITYRGEFRSDSQSSQTFGIGASFGF